MWLKHRVADQRLKKTSDQQSASAFLEAYHYALDLCDNPAIAREVASRFIKCLETEKSAIVEPELGKA